MTTDDDLRDVWRGRPAQADPARADCPGEDEWARLTAGEVSDAERERIAAHVATCRDCAEEYRLLQPLEAWADEAAQVLGPPVSRPAAAWAAWLTPSRAALALAAAVLLMIAQSVLLFRANLGHRVERARVEGQLTLERTRAEAAVRAEQQIAELRQQVNELSTPQINAPIVDLEPRDAVRGAVAPRTIALPRGVRLVTLVINAGGGPAFPEYAVQIVDPSGRTSWEGTGLKKSAFDTFTLTMPAHLLPAGRVQLRLFGVRGDQRTALQDYAIQVEYR